MKYKVIRHNAIGQNVLESFFDTKKEATDFLLAHILKYSDMSYSFSLHKTK